MVKSILPLTKSLERLWIELEWNDCREPRFREWWESLGEKLILAAGDIALLPALDIFYPIIGQPEEASGGVSGRMGFG